MKTNITSLRHVAARYNTTLSRAATEILAASGEEPRHLPAVVRKQAIPFKLVIQAAAYRARKRRQASVGM